MNKALNNIFEAPTTKKSVQRMVLIDNKNRFFSMHRLPSWLTAKVGCDWLRVVSVADLASAQDLLKAEEFDLAVIAEDTNDASFSNRIESIQLCNPGLVCILVKEQAGSTWYQKNTSGRSYAFAAMIMYRSNAETTWRIKQELLKIEQEKQWISESITNEYGNVFGENRLRLAFYP